MSQALPKLTGAEAKDAKPIVAAYIWDAAPFLDQGPDQHPERHPEQRPERHPDQHPDQRLDSQLAQLRKHGFDRMLLSLNPNQIHGAKADPGPLARVLRSAGERGLAVELLLGEPSWLLPEYRPGLLSIIQDLSGFAFDGLHLDIEPYQLPAYPEKTAEYARLTAETINQVAAISPWPVSCSLHPLFFDQESPAPALAITLDRSVVAYVALMAYTSNRAWLVQRMQSILSRYPDINFVLAQSVELDQGSELSLASMGRLEFMRHLEVLGQTLDAPNFKGFAVQAWEDFQKIRDGAGE